MPQQVLGPTGRMKNCDSWAEYEAKGTSETAAMCHGGWFEDERFRECPSKYDCKKATEKKNKRHLALVPSMNPAKPYGGSKSGQGSTILGSTEPMFAPYNFADLTTTVPTRKAETASTRKPTTLYPSQVPVDFPQPIQPPEVFPEVMRTPFVAPRPVPTQGITPTFLPVDGESRGGRLGKNILQGMIGAGGWHIYDFARSVDLFGQR